MKVRTSLSQYINFNEENLKNITDVEVHFNNGQFQYIKFKIKGYDSFYHFSGADIDFIRELKIICDKILEFDLTTANETKNFLEKNSGRKLRPQDLER